MSELLRVYFNPAEIGEDGYPYAWHGTPIPNPDYPHMALTAYLPMHADGPIKDLIRERDGHRCLRCHHPYRKGMGRWSRCDEHCTHGGPIARETFESGFGPIEAEWRILTVHHLNMVKVDCRWWNLVSLCQRCHLTIQLKVRMHRPYWGEHSEWFKPFVAAFYANVYLGEELTWEETHERMEELLALEHRQLSL